MFVNMNLFDVLLNCITISAKSLEKLITYNYFISYSELESFSIITQEIEN